MSAQRQIEWISEEEYREGEELSPVKHEWFQGGVFAMAGGTFSHATICTNVSAAAKNALGGRRCTALSGEMRVKIEATGLHTYPDAVIFCPPARFEGRGDNTLLTPGVFTTRDEVLTLENVEIELPLDEIYEELEFAEGNEL